MFIVFDGIDGAGKSTQIDLACRWLEPRIQRPIVRLADPGSTPLGQELRQLLLSRHDLAPSAMAEMLMFMAARAELVETRIVPSREKGEWVVCDRFSFSTVVYQGHAGGLDPEAIWAVNQVATRGILPDLTILLDLPAVLASERVGASRDRMESRGLPYFERVRLGFLTEAKRWPRGVQVLDANRSVQAVHRDICMLLEQRLNGFAI